MLYWQKKKEEEKEKELTMVVSSGTIDVTLGITFPSLINNYILGFNFSHYLVGKITLKTSISWVAWLAQPIEH